MTALFVSRLPGNLLEQVRLQQWVIAKNLPLRNARAAPPTTHQKELFKVLVNIFIGHFVSTQNFSFPTFKKFHSSIYWRATAAVKGQDHPNNVTLMPKIFSRPNKNTMLSYWKRSEVRDYVARRGTNYGLMTRKTQKLFQLPIQRLHSREVRLSLNKRRYEKKSPNRWAQVNI